MAIATSSISGLASGLDTATIIDQLMTLEAATQTNIKTQMATQKSSLTNLQDLNSQISSLATMAANLAKPATWANLTAKSSSTAAAVTATSDASPGSFSFTVQQTAVAHKFSLAQSATLDARVTGADSTTVRLTKPDGTTLDLDTGDGTLGSLVKALNGADTGVRATTLKLDDGTYRLQVTSATTGAGSQLALKIDDSGAGTYTTDLLGGVQAGSETLGQNAAIKFGTDTVTSTSNSFTNVIPGTTITLAGDAAADTNVTMTVGRDTSSMTGQVQSLVDAMNSALDKISALTAYNSTTQASGPLSGESSVRMLRDQLLNSIYPTDGTSLSSLGIQVDRSGNLTFDSAAFASAYAADPVGVAAKFTTGDTTQGFAARVQSVAKAASDSTSGSITSVITGKNSTIKAMQDSIDDWDTRLALRRDTLNAQYTAMETAMNTLKSQSSWLTSQISALPTNNKES